MCEPVPRPSIGNADITVGLGVDKMAFTLQLMVLPRVSVDIEGYIEPINPTEEEEASNAGLFDTTISKVDSHSVGDRVVFGAQSRSWLVEQTC